MPDQLVPVATRRAPTGMVCSVDGVASEAGLAALRAGGSAVDAAVATSAVLAVTTQHLCGMGGDLFALVHDGSGAPHALDASGRAGSGADPHRLRAEGHTTMPSLGDIRTVPVPGCVDGWLALQERFGRLPLGEVLAPAIAYASDGFPASPLLAQTVSLVADVPGAEDYTSLGRVRAGTQIRRPGVARALRAVAEGGRDAWYGGEFGEGLLALGAGEYTEADLMRSSADWTDPISLPAWDATIWTTPPGSQGYLTPSSAWLAERTGLLPDDPDDPAWPHVLVEAARAAGHDRLSVLHEGAEGAVLLDEARLAPRVAAIEPDRTVRWDDETYASGGTIALTVVDGDRMGVTLLQSNAAGWGAHLVVPGVKVFLHGRGIGFSLAPGHPAEYGPGRRPPSTLSPALVTRPDGSLHTVLGTMGGDSQPQVLLQLLARLLAGRQSPAAAVAAGRFALSGSGGGFRTWDEQGRVTIDLEGNAEGSWDAALAERGHAVRRWPAFDHHFGHAHLITVAGDHLAGATDPRARTGSAAAY